MKNKKKPALFRGQDSLDTGLDAEIGGEAIGIPGVVVVRVAVRVHIAEVVAVVVVRRTLPPIRSGQRESPKPTGFTEMHPIFMIW